MSKLSLINLVGNEYELRETARMARMDLYDKGEQGIFSDIDIVETPRKQKLITISKRMERINSSSERFDELLCRGVTANDAKSIFDIGVRGKVEDVAFPFKEKIRFYGPLTDVNSKNMKFFVTEEAAETMEGVGVNFKLMDEELQEIKSIPATHEQYDLAEATYSCREEIASLKRQRAMCRSRIIARHPEWADLPHDEFVLRLMREGSGNDARRFLELDMRLIKNKRYIDTYSASIMSLTLPKVYVPDHISTGEIKLPRYDMTAGRYVSEKLTLEDVNELANRNVEQMDDIYEIPSIIMDDII